MRWFRRRGGDSPPPTPLGELLTTLDGLGDAGNEHAAGWAAAIREDPKAGTRRLLVDAARHVSQFKGWLTIDSVIAAAARYDLAANGNNWADMPSELDRMRAATNAARLNAASERLKERLARMNARAGERALAAVRTGRLPAGADAPVTLAPASPARPSRAAREASGETLRPLTKAQKQLPRYQLRNRKETR